MKKIKRIMVLLVMLALSISAFVLPAQSGRVYADTRVTNLTGTTWEFKDDIDLSGEEERSYSINFYEYYALLEEPEYISSHTYNGLQIASLYIGGQQGMAFEDIYDGEIWCTYNNEKTFVITGGDDADDSDLIDWLYLNADLQVEEPAQTGVVTDIVIPVVLAVVVGTMIAFVVMDSKKIFVK